VSRLPWHSAAAGRIGPRHAVSEDAFLDAAEAGLWAVADGLGGHRDGAIASALVVRELGLARLPQGSFAARVAAAEAAITAAWRALLSLADPAGDDRAPSSTVAAILLNQTHAACLWVGDSRIYLWRAGRVFQLTRDHTLAQDMVDAGVIGAERDAARSERSVLTRAIGAGSPIGIDRVVVQIQLGDRLLLCTDGLSGVIEPSLLERWLGEAPSVAAPMLTDLAVQHGSTDDVTAVVVALGGGLGAAHGRG